MSLGSNTPGNRMKTMQSSTFLSRLRRDQKGNALAIVAASIIPLVGAIGGGVDLTRAYMAEARLAQACDAAALAGRKVMMDAHADSSGNIDWDSATGEEIQRFIEYNFPNGKFNTDTITRTANVNSEGELTITLATAMPTQLLRVVGIDSIDLNTDCSARRSGVNVDVVLVVDVTGSMKGSLGSTTRLGALKSATLSFLDTLDDLRDQLASSGTRVRVAIVPYSITVNVGLDLYAEDPNFINFGAAEYYSREYLPRYCQSSNNYCSTNDSSYNGKWQRLSSRTGNISLDISEFVSRGASAASYTYPYNWKGCIEMRQTIQTIDSSSSLDSIPDDAWDIRDVAPGVDGAPKWQPFMLLPNADITAGRYGPPSSGAATTDNTFKKVATEAQRYTRVPYRLSSGINSGPALSYTQATGSSVDGKGPNNTCNDRVKILQESTREDLEIYVTNLTASGGTYHDVGMYWGLSLISPQAPFSNPSTYLAPGFSGTPRGVNRYIVFMTDGKIEPFADYSAWGYERYPSNANNHTVDDYSDANLVSAHRARFRMICEEAKRSGIEISTVAFSSGVGLDDENSLKSCATSEDNYYKTETADGLESAFLKIAQSIGYLRVSK